MERREGVPPIPFRFLLLIPSLSGGAHTASLVLTDPAFASGTLGRGRSSAHTTGHRQHAAASAPAQQSQTQKKYRASQPREPKPTAHLPLPPPPVSAISLASSMLPFPASRLAGSQITSPHRQARPRHADPEERCPLPQFLPPPPPPSRPSARRPLVPAIATTGAVLRGSTPESRLQRRGRPLEPGYTASPTWSIE